MDNNNKQAKGHKGRVIAMIKSMLIIAIVALTAILPKQTIMCTSFVPTIGHGHHQQQLQQLQQEMSQYAPDAPMQTISNDPIYDYQMRPNSEQNSRDFARALIQLMMAKSVGAIDDRYSNSIDGLDMKRSYYKPCSVNPVSCFGRRRRR